MTLTIDSKTYEVTSGPLPMQSSSMYRFDQDLTVVEVTDADGGKVGWTMIHTASADASTVLEAARGVVERSNSHTLMAAAALLTR